MIRRLDPTDRKVAADLLVLQTKSYRAESRLIKVVLPSGRQGIEAIMNDTSTFFGYFDKNKLVGALAYKRDQDKLKITRLFVDPERQRAKIASHLYAHLINGEASAKRILVEVAEKNHPALSFYQKYGFATLETYQKEGISVKLLERLTLAWELEQARNLKPYGGALIAIALAVLMFLLGRKSKRHF